MEDIDHMHHFKDSTLTPAVLLDGDKINRNHGKIFSIFTLIALNAYLSTPKFIKCLTDLSDRLIEITNRTEFLKEEIKKIN